MKVKPKILSPTLRIRKRYVVFQVFAEEKLAFEEISHALRASLLEFAGELNTALSRIWIMKDLWNKEKQIGVLKCVHTSVELVRASMILINRIGDVRISFRILGVSGTLKSAKRKFMDQRTLEEFERE